MGAKVRWDRGAWWVVTHHRGKRHKKRLGPTKADKRRAEKAAEQIDAAIVLGVFKQQATSAEKPLACDQELRRWAVAYAPTMKRSYEMLNRSLIDRHLIPYFG